jgi:ankyrin repeat protein
MDGWTPFHFAADNGHLDIVGAILLVANDKNPPNFAAGVRGPLSRKYQIENRLPQLPLPTFFKT